MSVGTYVYDGCCAAVQVLVEVIENLPQLLHGLLVGLEQHGLEVDREAIPVRSHKQGP